MLYKYNREKNKMKKLLTILCALLMILSLSACGGKKDEEPVVDDTPVVTDEESPAMTYEEYVAADFNTEVVLDLYAQASQSWWDGKIKVYATDDKGNGVFVYDMACDEADAEWFKDGNGFRVTGFKDQWSGEIEVVDGTFTKLSQTYTAQAKNMDEYFGDNDALSPYQNQLVSFTGVSVESIAYKNDEPGDDIYLTVSRDGKTMDLCVERYLTDPESEVYTTVGELSQGSVIDFEGFLYWYEGANPHITSITVK